MKTFKLLIIGVIVLFFVQACNNKPKTVAENVEPPSPYSCAIFYKGDSINKTINGIKQGHFILFDKDIQCITSLTSSGSIKSDNEIKESITSPGKPIEEGDFRDDKKEGEWSYYNSDGTLNSTKDYKDGVEIK